MAKLCEVSVRTVQFYDGKGLLVPSELSEGGRRLYSDGDLQRLRLICTLKAIGLSLSSIKGILESESPGKVLSLLLDEQSKQISEEIAERQRQLDMIALVKENVHNQSAIPVKSIIDIEEMMSKNERVRKKFRRLFATSIILSIPMHVALAWWVFGNGPWVLPLVLFLIDIPVGVLVAKRYFKDAAFICAECGGVFTAKFWDLMRTSGTTKARWLTCTKCGRAGYCVETITDPEPA